MLRLGFRVLGLVLGFGPTLRVLVLGFGLGFGFGLACWVEGVGFGLGLSLLGLRLKNFAAGPGFQVCIGFRL